MAKAAIHYVKHLKELQDELTLDNNGLAGLSGIKTNSIVALRGRNTVKKLTQNKVRDGLKKRALEQGEKSLDDCIGRLKHNGASLTFDDVFQSAVFRCVDLGARFAGLGWETKDLTGAPAFLSEKQIKQISSGAHFTLWIRQQIEAHFQSRGETLPAGFIVEDPEEAVVAFVDESSRSHRID